MPNVYAFHELDPDLFPELRREPGVYTLTVAMLDPKRDQRLPAPADSPLVLLGSYRLLATDLPRDARLQLTIRGQRDGAPHATVLDLIEPAPPGDNLRFAEWDASVLLPPGTVWQRVFWIDLAPLLATAELRSGDTLTLSYGAARASVALPMGQRGP